MAPAEPIGTMEESRPGPLRLQVGEWLGLQKMRAERLRERQARALFRERPDGRVEPASKCVSRGSGCREGGKGDVTSL